MVITLEQVQQRALQVNATKLADLERKIDEALVRNFKPGDTYGVCITLGVYPGTYLYSAMEEKYRQAGWKVEYESDQRDGDFVRFTAGRQRNEHRY